MNPGRLLGSVTKGFQPRVVMGTLPVVGGALGNAMLSGVVSGYLPDMLSSGPGNLVVGLGTAGVLGAGVGMLAPKMAAPVFLGGVIEVVTRGVKQYLMPAVGMSGCMGGCCGLAGCGDYGIDMMTGGRYGEGPVPDFAQASGLNRTGVLSYAQASGINPYHVGMQGVGDYLTRQNAAQARPLGDYFTRQNAVQARPLNAYALNDYPIESVASQELTHTY